MDPELAIKQPPREEIFEYKAKDVILYALGVGATTKDDLKYLYENHEDFQALPQFAVITSVSGALMDWPGITFDLPRILHGEQFMQLLKPIPTEGKLIVKSEVVDVLDKGSGALILVNITLTDTYTKEVYCKQQIGTFQIGYGGFGGKKDSPAYIKPVTTPTRTPDKVVEQKTSVDQATLYRLGSGDMNPLHIDPAFAKLGGRDQPILHGLCSFGFSVRHVLKAYGGDEPKRIKAIKVRFTNPVLPGQTLQTEMWKEGDRIFFQTKAKESGKTVISGAYIDIEPASKC